MRPPGTVNQARHLHPLTAARPAPSTARCDVLATSEAVLSDIETLDSSLALELTRIGFESAPFGMSLTSADARSFGRFVLVNAAYCRLTGYAAEELRARTFHDIVAPDDIGIVLKTLDALFAGTLPAIDLETRLVRRDGTTVWVRQHRSLVRSVATGEPRFIFSHTEDVSERKVQEAAAAALTAERDRAEQALRESEARYRLLAEHAADMIVCTRPDRTRAYVSPASQTLLGYAPEEILECDFAEYLHPDDRERVCAAYELFLRRGGRETHTYRLRRKDGSFVWAESAWVAATAAPGPGGSLTNASVGEVVAVVRDVSERKAAEAKIAFLAAHDALTGLANRLLFREQLREALAGVERGAAAAVLCIDLDHFKAVNDAHGHAAGDRVLQAVAQRLKGCVRSTDTVARLGGDEFAVVTSGVGHREASAEALAQRIVDVLGRPYDIDEQRFVLGASVGVAVAPIAGRDADTLLHNADIALYRAKAAGRCAHRVYAPNDVSAN